jgi:hypothetical protein
MTRLQTPPADASQKLTPRQREVYRLRHESGATIEQIAGWLKISPRAVLYRLQCAERRMGETISLIEEMNEAGRVYSASQISVAARGDSLNIDDL